MRWAGSMAPGNCGAVFTGQAVFFIPAFTAFTSAMLSFLVRPLMVGTEIGGAFSAASLPPVGVGAGPPGGGGVWGLAPHAPPGGARRAENNVAEPPLAPQSL